MLPADTAARDQARVAELLQLRRSWDDLLGPAVRDELEAMGDAAVPGLVAAIETNRRGWRRSARYGVLALLLLSTAGLLRSTTFWPALFVQWIVFGFVDNRAAPFFKKVDVPALQALMKIGDVRSVGALITAYEQIKGSEDRDLAQELLEEVTRLLPRLTFADGYLLQEKHRRILRGRTDFYFLTEQSQREFLFATVKALVQIGDTDSLPALRRLALWATHTDVGRIASLGATELAARMAAGEGANQ